MSWYILSQNKMCIPNLDSQVGVPCHFTTLGVSKRPKNFSGHFKTSPAFETAWPLQNINEDSKSTEFFDPHLFTLGFVLFLNCFVLTGFMFQHAYYTD